MKHLKRYKIFEAFSSEHVVLFKKLQTALHRSAQGFGIDFEYDDDGEVSDVVIYRTNQRDEPYYEIEIDDFAEAELRRLISLPLESDHPDRPWIRKLDKIISNVLDGVKTNEWWEEYVDDFNSEYLNKIRTNVKKDTSLILTRAQIESFFQDVIDDHDEDMYSYAIDIKYRDGVHVVPKYLLKFKYELQLDKDNFTKSLTEFNNELALIHRGCKRIHVEGNILIDVKTYTHNNIATTFVDIYSKRDLLTGKTFELDVNGINSNNDDADGLLDTMFDPE